MNPANEIIIQVSKQLIQEDFRDKFEESVLSNIREVVHDQLGTEAAQTVWSDLCVFSHSFCQESHYNQLCKTYSVEAMDIYLEATRVAAQEGAFEMPSWGTLGT